MQGMETEKKGNGGGGGKKGGTEGEKRHLVKILKRSPDLLALCKPGVETILLFKRLSPCWTSHYNPLPYLSRGRQTRFPSVLRRVVLALGLRPGWKGTGSLAEPSSALQALGRVLRTCVRLCSCSFVAPFLLSEEAAAFLS